jgi:hypothetical protein
MTRFKREGWNLEITVNGEVIDYSPPSQDPLEHRVFWRKRAIAGKWVEYMKLDGWKADVMYTFSR